MRVVLILNNAPWHACESVRPTLTEHSHLERYRLPRYSPRLNVIERFWRVFRRRATHHWLFDTLADLKRSVRNCLGNYQTLRDRIGSLIKGCYAGPPKLTRSAALCLGQQLYCMMETVSVPRALNRVPSRAYLRRNISPPGGHGPMDSLSHPG